MKQPKMAELKFEAPLAKFDGDEWNEYNDFQTASDIENSNKTNTDTRTGQQIENTMSMTGNGMTMVDNFNETFSDSLEDLVNTFDEKLSKCFCNFNENVETFAPVQVRTQEDIMNDCQMWWTITGNYGNILPIDWSKSYARKLQEKSLNLGEKHERDSPDLDLSDDEELQQAFDIHSLIISSLQQEPMFTADDVINEIEGMMDEDSPCLTPPLNTPTPTGTDIVNAATAELLQFRQTQTLASTCNQHEQRLKELPVHSLNELYDELEETIREHSETLIQDLALRDELDYEKELKNQFISLLLSVQKRRRDAHAERKRNGGLKKQRASNGGGVEPGTYLTTVIPYHPNQGPPTIEQLQIYIKILSAINDDSPAVPGLLTDYILKVLCPTI